MGANIQVLLFRNCQYEMQISTICLIPRVIPTSSLSKWFHYISTYRSLRTGLGQCGCSMAVILKPTNQWDGTFLWNSVNQIPLLWTREILGLKQWGVKAQVLEYSLISLLMFNKQINADETLPIASLTVIIYVLPTAINIHSVLQRRWNSRVRVSRSIWLQKQRIVKHTFPGSEGCSLK